MTPKSDQEREDGAVDALLAAAFRLDENRELSPAEASELLKRPPQLSEEDEALVASWGEDFVDQLLEKQQGVEQAKGSDSAEIDSGIETACAAMNRGREGGNLDKTAEEEIERKRRELLGEGSPEDEDDDGS